MRSRLFVLFAFCFVPLCAAAQDFAGVWEGALSVNGGSMRLLFRVSASERGYEAVLDCPDQGVRGIPVDSVSVGGSEVVFGVAALQASYRGALLPGDMLVGVFRQGGMDFSLLLRRRDPAATARPQEPRPPYPYVSREVSFPSRAEGVTLRGTLTLPAGERPAAAVVLVTGSGQQNRDEEVFGHKPFLVIADFLTRRGIAVLRYDDRGFGVPEEERRRLLERAATADFALRQNRRAMELQGFDAALTEACCSLLERIYAEVRERPQERLAAECGEVKARLAAAEPAVSLPRPVRERLLALLDEAASNAWVYRFLTFDPSEAIARAGGRPVLALNGSLDRQVDAAENLGAIRRLLASSERLTVREYGGLNHLFQPCTTGDVSEYETIGVTVAPEVLEELAAWIAAAGAEGARTGAARSDGR